MKSKNRRNLKTSANLRNPVPLVLVLGLMVAGVMGYSLFIGSKTAVRYAPLSDAAMEIKLEAAIGHLWFEEVISGDRHENIIAALAHIDQSAWYARAMLDGGENSEGVFVPLQDPELRREIEEVLEKITNFRAIAVTRWDAAEQSGIGSDIDQRFDSLFNQLLSQADDVESTLQAVMARELHHFRNIQILLIVLCLGLAVIASFIFHNYQKNIERGMKELQKSEESLSTTLYSIGDAVIATDTAGNVTRLNPVAENLTHWKSAEAKGRPLDEVFHIINSHTRKEIESPVTKVLKEGKIVGLANHTVLIARDGTEYHIADSGAPIRDPQGNITGVVLVFRDVTDQMQQEKERNLLAQAIEQTNESVVITDAQGIILYINPVFERVTGYSSDEIVGFTSRILRSEEHDDVFYENLWNVISSGDTWRGRFINRKKNGNLFTEDSTISPVFNDSGIISNYVAVKKDVTDKLHLEEQYHQAQKVESLGRLAGGVAHDLNNLLTPILGYGEMIMEDLSPDDPQKEGMGIILQSGIRARDLVRQLLAFSRKQTLEYKPVSLNHIVENFESLLQRTIREDIRVTLKTSSESMVVLADIGQIEQVIMNLAINAADAMPDGGHLTIETNLVELDVEYTATHHGVVPGRYCMLAISDSGFGMDHETCEKIFDPFFSTKGEHGTGLGLATVYGIVKQHGGNIWVYSEPGEGTTFKVFLPASDKSVELAVSPPKRSFHQKHSETILLAEDNLEVRNLAHNILTKEGYKVLVAEDGPAALSMQTDHEGPLHLLLTDVIMPEMNGKQLFSAACEKHPDLRVLYMSGYTDNVIVHHGVLAENTAFIQKPFTVQALACKVREVLEKP